MNTHKRTAMNTHIKFHRQWKKFTTYYRGSVYVDIWNDGTWSCFNEKGKDCHYGEYRHAKGGKYCFVQVDGVFFPEEALAALRRHFKAQIVLQSNRWFFKKRPNEKEIWL